MAFKRPFRVDDFVETGPVRGKVLALNIRDTRLKTPDDKDVYVPNANIIKNPLINYAIDGFLRFDFVVGLPAGSDCKALMKGIENAVNGVEGVLKKRRKTSVAITGISPGRINPDKAAGHFFTYSKHNHMFLLYIKTISKVT